MILIEIVIWISLITNSVDHIFMCLFAIYISFACVCVCSDFSHFLIVYVFFFSVSFIILSFTGRSVTHFELIFVCDARYELKFTFSAYGCPVLQPHFLKRLPFLHWIAFVPLSEITSRYMWVYFWILFCSIGLFVHVYNCINYRTFIRTLEIGLC